LDQVEDHPTIVDPDHTQVGGDLDLANLSHTQTVTNIELANHAVEESLEEETHDPVTTTLPEETLKENPVIEPSPKFYKPEEFIKDLIFLDQYPQDEVIPLTPIDLFPEINNPFFYQADPIGIPHTHKVNLISIRLIPETPSCLLVYPINPNPFSYFLPYQTNT